MDPTDYRQEKFEPFVGTQFGAQLADGRALELQLIEVRPGVSNDRMHQFALTFIGPAQPLLPQQIVRLTHRDLGDMDIFIVPVAANSDGVHYEAVFSRLIR
jgi:hypothetical protein